MAIGKSIMTPKGMASFWIIGTTWRDNFNKTAFVSLYGYESREHCDYPGAMYKERYDYCIGPLEFDKYFPMKKIKARGRCDLDQFYNYIKENDMRFFASDNLMY